jgi:SpoIID/LytB domain protein
MVWVTPRALKFVGATVLFVPTVVFGAGGALGLETPRSEFDNVRQRVTTPTVATARATTPIVTTPIVTTARVTTPIVTTPIVTTARVTTPIVTRVSTTTATSTTLSQASTQVSTSIARPSTTTRPVATQSLRTVQLPSTVQFPSTTRPLTTSQTPNTTRVATTSLVTTTLPASTSSPPQTVVGGGLAPTTFGPAVAAPGRVIIDGRGFGHGVGMAQDGAYWMGKQGKTATQILKHFYPGTVLSKRGGSIRVPFGSANVVQVVLPQGGTVGGRTIPVGGYVRLVANDGVVSANIGKAPAATTSVPDEVAISVELSGGINRFGIETGVIPTVPTTPTSSNSPVVSSTIPAQSSLPVPDESTVPVNPGDATSSPVPTSGSASDGVSTIPADPADPALQTSTTIDSSAPTIEPTIPVEADGGSQSSAITSGTIRVTAGKGGVVVYGGKRYRGSFDFIAGSTGMRVVNEVDVEQYLRGMGEMRDPRWPAATLQSQAIAARTYAIRMMGTRGEVCPTQSCQVYLGAVAEYPQMDAAVAATAGKVVTYKGDLANTFYSASGGGTMADPSEVFGPGKPIEYLQAGTYYTGDPKAWRVELSIADLGRRLGYPGTLYDVFVSEVGKSGRAVQVTLSGSVGARRVFGPKFDAALGLRSTNFQLYVGRSSSVSTIPFDPNAPVLELDLPDTPADNPLGFQSDLQAGDQATSVPGADSATLAATSSVIATAVTTAAAPSSLTETVSDETVQTGDSGDMVTASSVAPMELDVRSGSLQWPLVAAGGLAALIAALVGRRVIRRRTGK